MFLLTQQYWDIVLWQVVATISSPFAQMGKVRKDGTETSQPWSRLQNIFTWSTRHTFVRYKFIRESWTALRYNGDSTFSLTAEILCYDYMTITFPVFYKSYFTGTAPFTYTGSIIKILLLLKLSLLVGELPFLAWRGGFLNMFSLFRKGRLKANYEEIE